MNQHFFMIWSPSRRRCRNTRQKQKCQIQNVYSYRRKNVAIRIIYTFYTLYRVKPYPRDEFFFLFSFSLLSCLLWKLVNIDFSALCSAYMWLSVARFSFMQILNMALNRLTEKPHLYCHNTLPFFVLLRRSDDARYSVSPLHLLVKFRTSQSIVFNAYNKRSTAPKMIATVRCSYWAKRTCTFSLHCLRT